jgi:hypothetical protein
MKNENTTNLLFSVNYLGLPQDIIFNTVHEQTGPITEFFGRTVYDLKRFFLVVNVLNLDLGNKYLTTAEVISC